MPEGKAKNAKKPKKKNNVNYKIFVLLFCVIAFIVYLVVSIYGLFKKPTDLFVVEEGTLSQEEMAEAYVIRSETVLQGQNYKNGMAKIKLEGERVPLRWSDI